MSEVSLSKQSIKYLYSGMKPASNPSVKQGLTQINELAEFKQSPAKTINSVNNQMQI